jgi:hypothetical protein
MAKLNMVLGFIATAAVASTFISTEASARYRTHHVVVRHGGCFDRLPAYGTDGCGLPEFSHGQDSCWRRVEAYTRQGPRATRVSICGVI